MKRNELDNLYTTKVTFFLTHGYTVNTNTMNSSQGEIAKVDLRKGNDVLRVMMVTFSSYENNLNGISIIVGRNTKPLKGRFSETIWNDNLDIIEETKFYAFGYSVFDSSWFTMDIDEAKAAADKKYDRCVMRDRSIKEMTSIKNCPAIMSRIHFTRGMKKVKEGDVTVIIFTKNKACGPRYYVECNGKRIK